MIASGDSNDGQNDKSYPATLETNSTNTDYLLTDTACICFHQIYQVTAVQFLGSTESGLGMPSISKWAQAQKARQKQKRATNKTQSEAIVAGLEMVKLQKEFEEKLQSATSDEERTKIQAEMEEASSATLLKIFWTTTVVDITATLYETCQMVFYDASVDKDTRKRRARGVRRLGEIFQECPEPAPLTGDSGGGSGTKTAKALYEEAAFAAMLETIKRKDESSYNASYRVG